MKLILNILLVIGIAFSSLAQAPKTELDVLTDNYNKAKERAVKPIDDKYKEELKKLLEKYSKQGNVTEVEKITPLLKDDIPHSPIKEYSFIGEWKSAQGTAWLFFKDGTGEKTFAKNITRFLWSVEDDIIIIDGRNTVDSPLTRWYAKYNKGVIVYGPTRDTMSNSMSRF